MSVICSDSDNDVDSFQIDYYSKAYKKGRSGPTTCFSPKSHSVPAFRSRMRPLSLSRSNRKQQCSTKPSYSDDRRTKSVTSRSGDNLKEYQSHILSSTVENSTEQHFISELSVGRKPDHHYSITNTEDGKQRYSAQQPCLCRVVPVVNYGIIIELKVADVRLLSPHDNSKQVLAQDDTKDMGYTSMVSAFVAIYMFAVLSLPFGYRRVLLDPMQLYYIPLNPQIPWYKLIKQEHHH
jgi:hypothetical protein